MRSSVDKKITVLVYSLQHGGAEKVCVTLCNELIRRNYEVELWVVDFENTSLAKQLHKQVQVYSLNKKHVRNSIYSVARLLLKRKPQKLLIFHVELAVLVILLKKILFLKTVVIVRSINTLSQAYRYPKGIWEKYIAGKTFKYLLKSANAIVAQSTGMQNDLIKSFSIPPQKIITIYNPAHHLNAIENSIEVYNSTQFLFVGRLSKQKGIDNMIEAFKKAHDQNKSLRLWLVGEGPERYYLEKIVDEYQLNESISFEGFQTGITAYFKKAKATLLTSHFEGFPNVLVESISVGTPVISFNCPSGPDDIIEEGKNGLLIPYPDVDKFSQAILDVASNTIEFEKQKVMETARKFSLDVVADKYEDLIRTTQND